jgi:hypothetical protein
MAIKNHSRTTQQLITFLSTDTKPTLGIDDTGTKGYETDTGIKYEWTGADWIETGTKSTNNAGHTIGGSLALRKDDTGIYTYLGEAIPGTATSAAEWRIQRITNADSTIVWADGNGSFDNVWDDHATLISYS